MLELVKSNEVEKSEQNYIYSAKDIWELSNSSKSSWDRFVTEFLSVIDGDQKRDYLEEHASRSGGNKYTKEEICSICNCSISSFEHFAPQVLTERDFIVLGSNHKKLHLKNQILAIVVLLQQI